MKVAIDISPLKNQHQFRGVGKYTKHLVEVLQSIKADDFSVELIEKGIIPQNCDLVHYPYFDLFYLTLPLIKSRPTIVTVHDVIPLIFPKHFPPGIKGRFKFLVQKFSLQGAATVITDSQNSKKDIIKYLGFPAKKIFVISLAPGKEFKQLKVQSSKFKVKNKYRLPDNFILYVGDVNYHKNVPGLIKAFRQLTISVKLVLVGKAFRENDLKETRQIVQLIKSLGLMDKIICPGWVPEDELAVIYNLATVYCQSSFYEGFGIPVLEAMACGTPVVAANVASLPEIVGEAAVMVDPGDINSIANGIKEAMTNRQQLAAKGLVQARKFSWEKTASKTLSVYQKALQNVKNH